MKSKLSVLLCTGLLLLATPGASALERGRRGGGGEMPDPLSTANQFVELAEGEIYVLKGRVIVAPDFTGESRRMQAYFVVDLNTHTWLASVQRVKNPAYPIEGPVSRLRKYEGLLVALAARARGRFVDLNTDMPRHVITLEPMLELSEQLSE